MISFYLLLGMRLATIVSMIIVLTSLINYRREFVAWVLALIPIGSIFRASVQFMATINVWTSGLLPWKSFVWAACGELPVIVTAMIVTGIFRDWNWCRFIKSYLENISKKYN